MCAQRWLRSAWASAQPDQSLRCPHEETFGPQLPIERTAKTLIRLGGCPGWSESSLGAKTILLVLSWGGSNVREYPAMCQCQVWNLCCSPGQREPYTFNIQTLQLQYQNISLFLMTWVQLKAMWCNSEISEPRHDKTNKMSVRPAKTQISLGICPVWSESLLST